MTDAGTHALLKKWADAVALRTVHRGVYSPDSTRTVSWASLENCAWSTLDTPVALVKVTQPGVAQPRSLTNPLLSLFDNNPNLQATVLHLHDTDARAVVEHVKKSCGGPNRGMSLYLREWKMPDGTPGIHVSGDLAAGWHKWECKAQQVQRGHWEDMEDRRWLTTSLPPTVNTRSLGSLLKAPKGSAATTSSASPIY